MDRSSREKIKKEALALNDPLDQKNLIDIYKENIVSKSLAAILKIYTFSQQLLCFFLELALRKAL